MIKFLKKRKYRRTARLLAYFKKPTIHIIDNNNEAVAADVADVAIHIASDVAADDNDDMISINMAKVSSITNKFKDKKGDLKKSIMTNASLVKELLIKTIDKHKIDMCTQMASQLVEVYNKKHTISSSSNEEIEISTNT
tara:strand:+ start:715 stop:1131 length:417 start_codon:yes stop_codon:yes gene_type:complete